MDAAFAPCNRANGSGSGGDSSVITLQGLSGLSPARTAPGLKAVQETGVPVTHSCIFDPPMQNTPDAPASAPRVPSPFPKGRFGVPAVNLYLIMFLLCFL